MTEKKNGSRKKSQATSASEKLPGKTSFSVREAFRDRTIFIIGGTGFLGRIMLFMLMRYVPDIKKIYILVRPTHGQTGDDRFRREILESPVFTTGEGDREFFQKMAREKIFVVEGDASRKGLGLKEGEAEQLAKEADLVLNTAGNVEFNPPLDLSLNANTLATREALDFTERTIGKRYVHISTCYVADRTVHRDTSPELIVSDTVKTSNGTDFRINPEKEIEDAKSAIEQIRREMESPEKTREFKERAREELKKMGRGAEERLVDKIFKSIRTYETREVLIKAGKEKASRINRPNVYTFTKTLAELLVKSRGDRIKYTIVRPSIVEAALRTPFEGWNEGVQGSAPLIYLMHRGHRMIPSLSNSPDQRPDAILDLIPVDLVAAGTLMAAGALLEERQKEIYQVAAGPISNPISVTRMLNISQTSLRDLVRDEDTGFKRWLRLNFQAVTVSRETFETFSSPRTLKFLTNARERLTRFDPDGLPKFGRTVFKKMQSGLEKFYSISVLKNKIFGEFMPFLNHGYPIFENKNAIDLWKELPADEKPLFFFNPLDMDYTTYLADIHVPGVVQWVFPILERRFQAINKLAGKDGADEQIPGWKTISAIFSSNSDFRERVRSLKDRAFSRFRENESDKEFQTGGKNKEGNGTSAEAVKQSATNESSSSYIKASIERLLGKDLRTFDTCSEEELRRLSDHLELIYGRPFPLEALKETRSINRLENQLKKIQEEAHAEAGPLRFTLPPDGLDMPNWIADPTRSFLYKVQMTFYDKILAADIRGRENIPRHRRVIVIANHSSHLDYGLVQYSLENFGRNLGIVAAKDYFFDRFWKSTFFGNFMTLVPIDRSEISYAAAFKPAVDCLNGGDPILIFPEGTRSEDGVMQPFKHGIGYLALHAKADILPIRLTGTHTALPKGRTIVRSRSVRVDIGQLIPFESLERATEGLSQRRSYDLITKRLQAAVRNIHTPFHAIASEAEMEARV